MHIKKFLIALAVTSIFNFSNATVNFGENFPSEMKVYAATNQELAKQKIEEGVQLSRQRNHQAAILKILMMQLHIKIADWFIMR